MLGATSTAPREQASIVTTRDYGRHSKVYLTGIGTRHIQSFCRELFMFNCVLMVACFSGTGGIGVSGGRALEKPHGPCGVGDGKEREAI